MAVASIRSARTPIAMISTYLGYQIYGNNLAQSLQRTAAEPAVTLDAQYYNANIGKVKTVSDLVNNYRLLSYATQAFGLGSMTYAKSLLTKVLESNLSDPKSLANTLNDSRYVAFAKAFNFNADGTIATTAQLQSSSQQADTEKLFAANNTTLTTAEVTSATTAYTTAMKSITSLSQLERSPAALGYVLDAYGINPSKAASTFEQTLESDLSSPTSFVNQQADSGYGALAGAVTVNADGSAASLTEAETNANVTATTEAYMSNTASDSTSQQTAATETSYFLSKITSITSTSQFVADPRLVAYVTKAYGLPSTANASSIEQALSSNPSDATSFARTSPYTGYLALAKAFNFDTTGAAKTVTQFQSTNQQQDTVALYTERQTSDTAAAAAATAYYNANIGSVTSVSSLESNSKLLNYVLTAYGISAKSSDATISSVLENTNGVASPATTPNAALLQLKADFNMDSNGNTTNPLTAQSSANITATETAYMANAKTDTASQTAAKAATAYYKNAIANVTSVSQLLADPKLVSYIEQAYNIPTSTSTGVLQKIFTSDVTNKKSFADSTSAADETLAAAFDFTSTGLIGPEVQGAQSKAQLDAINAAYVSQQMQIEAGAQNPGIALALYFQQNASKITDAYSILADTKLTTVFQTMLGLPSTASNADIDVQAKQISSSFNLSKMKDPTYVQSLIQRFSVLYDLNPPTSTTPDTVTSLFSGSTDTLDVTSLFTGTTDSATSTGSGVASLFA